MGYNYNYYYYHSSIPYQTKGKFKGTLLGGSWDLVSRVISTVIGVISNYNCTYLTYNPSY